MDINQKERRCGVTVWATWIYSDKSFEISFGTTDSTFETITNQIKSECTYYDILNETIYYSCPKSKYKGKIGFSIDEDGWGYVQTRIIY